MTKRLEAATTSLHKEATEIPDHPTVARLEKAIPFDNKKSPGVADELQPKRREPWFRPVKMIDSGPTQTQGCFRWFKRIGLCQGYLSSRQS